MLDTQKQKDSNSQNTCLGKSLTNFTERDP